MNPKLFSKSVTSRLLQKLADSILYRPRWYIYPQLVLAVLCIIYTVFRLDFLTSRNALVGAEKEYHRIYLQFKEEFPVADELVVVVESEDFERNRQFVERLGARLQSKGETNLFTGVFYKADFETLGRKALLFMPEETMLELRDTLKEFKPVLKEFAGANNLVRLFQTINGQFRSGLQQQSASQGESLIGALPALERIVSLATDGVSRPGRPPSPGVMSLFEEGREAMQQMYITFGKGRMFLLTVQARSEDKNEQAVHRLRELISEIQFEVPGTNVGLTGEPVLEVDEMAQSQVDTTIATVISLLLVALIFIFGYHETGRPLKATFVLLIGLAYTMGFTTLTVGHLNILTITFVPILIGLAIDFGVHLITRYEEELRHGRTQRDALEIAMVNTGMGIFTGAFTTAGAFFAMGFSSFKGVQEMGIICGGGMLVCLAAMMTLLPAMLLKGRQNTLDAEQGPALDHRSTLESDRRARLEKKWLDHPWMAVGITTAITLVCVWFGRNVGFDYNLLHMQSAGLPAVVFQDKLITNSTRSVLFGAIVADSTDEAARLSQALTNLPSVSAVETMATYLGKNQDRELAALREIKKELSDIRFQPVDPAPVDIRALEDQLFSLHGYLGMAAAVTAKEAPDIYPKIVSLRKAVGEFMHQLRVGDRKLASVKLGQYQRALFEDVYRTFDALRNQDASGPMTVQDLPESLSKRFVGIHGKYLLQVYPKKDVWDRAAQEEFVRDLRTVDAKVTGTPVQLLEYTTLLKNSYVEAAWYALIAISILVFVHFRRVSCVILSLLPVGLGTLWMVGAMGITGTDFNPANIMTLPLIIGIGVTNGIHILNRFAEEQHPSILSRSTGKAVLVSGLTTIAGFGSLLLAQHLGIRSLGFIMSVGVTTCMLVGLTFLPATLNLLLKLGWKIKGIQADQPSAPESVPK